MQGDPYLCDLHTSVTLEEVNSYIALEHGQAMTVNVRRADNVILRKNQSVLDALHISSEVIPLINTVFMLNFVFLLLNISV